MHVVKGGPNGLSVRRLLGVAVAVMAMLATLIATTGPASAGHAQAPDNPGPDRINPNNGALDAYCDANYPGTEGIVFSTGGATTNPGANRTFTDSGYTLTYTEGIEAGNFIIESVQIVDSEGTALEYEAAFAWIGGPTDVNRYSFPGGVTTSTVIVAGDTGQNIDKFGFCAYTAPPPGDLTVAKVVDAGTPTTAFTFSVACDGVSLGSVSVAAGGSATITDLDAGAVCTVTETSAADGYSLDPTPKTVTIVSGTSVGVSFTNNRLYGGITIVKNTINGDAAFNFSWTCTDPTGINASGMVTIGTTSGIGMHVEAGSIPTGSTCTVVEDVTSFPQYWIADSATSVVINDGGTATFTNKYVPPVFEGCTPGYWKNHTDRWPHVSAEIATAFEDRFDLSIEEALGVRGGGELALARHTAAALLNALSSGVDYEFSVHQILSGHLSKADLEAANEAGCPLGGSRASR